MEERLQKIIAAAGICSRRAAEELILAGKVQVNNRIIRQLGTKADADRDEIRVDGRLITTEVERLYLVLYKPAGYVTTMKDPEGRPVVSELLYDIGKRVYPVGRLDYDSEGLLIMTNDGSFAERVQHPRYEIPRTYLVKVRGRLARKDIQAMTQGDQTGGRALFGKRSARGEIPTRKASGSGSPSSRAATASSGGPWRPWGIPLQG